ncbi:MAG: hypothetical protein ACYS8Z_14970, partial [Planctomycetota bacterium]
MKQAQTSNLEKARKPKPRRRGRRWIFLAAVLAIIAVVFYFKEPSVNKQLKALAGKQGGYREEAPREGGW